MTTLNIKAEAVLNDSPLVDHNGNNILDHNSATILTDGFWDSVFVEDIQAPVSLSDGIRGGKITDRVARPGKVTFVLNNSEANYHTTLGYWSPDHASARSGWGNNTRVRIGLQKDTDATVWMFYGKVKEITPIPGVYAERKVNVTAYDYMYELQGDSEVKRIALLENVTSDEAYTAMLAVANEQPLVGTDFSTGILVMPSVFHHATGTSVRLFEEFVRIATSNFEYIYIDRGTMKSQNMVDRLTDTTVQFTLDNNMHGVDVSKKADSVPRKFTFNVHPVTVGTVKEVVASNSSPVRISPGETVEFELNYRDPSGGSKIAAKNITTPVANTHYKFATYEESEIGNYNSKLSVSITEHATSVEVSATNNGNAVGWIVFFELTGYIIRMLDIVSRSVETGEEGKEERINLYYQFNPNIAIQAATFASNVYGVDYAKSVTFMPLVNTTLTDGFLDARIGERVEVIEDVTGVSSEYFINGVSWEFKGKNDITATYILAPARSHAPWVVGTSEVGTGLVLFGGG